MLLSIPEQGGAATLEKRRLAAGPAHSVASRASGLLSGDVAPAACESNLTPTGVTTRVPSLALGAFKGHKGQVGSGEVAVLSWRPGLPLSASFLTGDYKHWLLCV